MVRVSLTKFKHMLSTALAERSKALISPARFSFREDKMHFKQTTPDRILAVWAEFEKDYFEGYEPVGDVVFDPARMLSIVADHFRQAFSLELEKKDGELVLASDFVRYSEPMLDFPEDLAIDNSEVLAFDSLVYPKPPSQDFSLRAVYQFDIGVLKSAKKKWELVTFIIEADKIRYVVDLGAGKLESRLPVKVLKQPDREYRFALRAELVASLAKALSGIVTIGIIANDQGELGPVVFSVKGDNYGLSYWVVAEVA